VKLITSNTIAFVLLCGLFLTLAYHMTNRQRITLRELHWRVEDLEARREVLVSSFREIGATAGQPYSLDTNAQNQGKFLPSEESPDLSFAYSDRLARHLSPGMDYRFQTGPENHKGLLRENQYTLAGEASFADIYQFVHALESGRAYYRIRHLHMKPTWDPFAVSGAASVKEKEIAFTLDLTGYSLQDSYGEDLYASAVFPVRKPLYNLFSPPRLPIWELGHDTADDGSTGLSRIDLPKLSKESTLVAISGNIAYMRDAQGKLVALREGDRVFEAQVIRVDHEEGYVEIDPTGEAERLMFRVGHTGMWETR
jgi:hypothetical protein